MGWFDAVDQYCERAGPGLWAEPLNAVTNLAFVMVALVLWRRSAGIPMARAMAVVLGAIGIGSGLFHTVANRAASVADVGPIVAFILLYLFAATRDLLGAPLWKAAAAVLAFVPYAAVMGVFFTMVAPWLGSSVAYAPVPVLIGFYAYLMWDSATARGLAIGAAVLAVSILIRTADGPMCGSLPMGTHFVWHLLNALMLGWMIEVYRVHVAGQTLAGRAARG